MRDIFDIHTTIEEWLSSSITVPNIAQAACMTSDNSNYLYIIGGETGIGGDILSYIQVYDINNKQWNVINDIQYPSGYLGCAYYDDNVFLFGGWGNNDKLDNIQAYDVGGGKWKALNSKLPQVLAHMRCIVGDDDLIYIIGGISSDSNYMKTVQVYNPSTDSMGYTTYLAQSHADSMVEIINHEIIICGGIEGNKMAVKTCQHSNKITQSPTASNINGSTPTPTALIITSSFDITAETQHLSSNQQNGSSNILNNNFFLLAIGFVVFVLIIGISWYCYKKKSNQSMDNNNNKEINDHENKTISLQQKAVQQIQVIPQQQPVQYVVVIPQQETPVPDNSNNEGPKPPTYV